MAGRGARPAVAAGRHGLEDRIDLVAVGEAGLPVAVAQSGQEHARHLGPRRAGNTGDLGRDHGLGCPPLGLVDAGQLVRGLDRPSGSQHPVGVDELSTVKDPGASHGAGQPVDRHPAAGHVAEDLGDCRPHRGPAFVQLGPQRSAQVRAGDNSLAGLTVGMEPGRTVGRTHDGHRTTVVGMAGIDGLGNPSGGIRNVGTMEQHSRVHALSPHLAAQTGQPLRPHTTRIRRRRRDLVHRGAVAAHCITMPRNRFDRGQAPRLLPAAMCSRGRAGRRANPAHTGAAVGCVAWFGRPVSAANKSGKHHPAPRGGFTYPRTLQDILCDCPRREKGTQP